MTASRTIIAAVLLPVLLAAAPAFSGERDPGDGIHIVADRMDHDQADDVIRAEGHVILHWQGAELSSDRAAYDRSGKTLNATGNVVITKGGDTVTGESVSLDLDSGRGQLSKGTVFLKQGNMRFSGDSLTRENENDYSARAGSYTTCDDPLPSWKFGAGDIDLTLEGYGTARDVVFYIKDVPVFYFPYLVFPVKRDRQSGFLFPRFGWSDRKGAQADIFYYWAISPSQEATIDLDIQTRRGVGTGLDYRYLLSRGSTGSLAGYLIQDLTTDTLRGSVAQLHREIFSPEMNLRTSINMTTDRQFLSDYGEKSGDYNRHSSDSTVNFLKTWQQYAFTANLRYTQDYYAPSNAATLQTLPELGLAAVRQRLFSTPLYFDLDSSATNFYRETGLTGQRLSAFPRLTLVSGVPGYLNLSAYAGIHLRAYHTDVIPAGSAVKENDGSLLPEAGLRLSGSLGRVYDVGGDSLLKLRHEIIPEVSYGYTPDRDQSRLPFYDFGDRIVHRNMLTFSLASFVGGKFRIGETHEYRDLLRLKLTQGYSVEGDRRDLLTMVDVHRPWTDLALESEAWLHPRVRLTLDGRFNVYDHRISSAAPGLEFDDLRGTSAGVSYRMAHKELEYLEGRLATKLFRPWAFSYAARYSFDRSDFLESVYAAEYRHQCWSVTVSYRDRRVTNPGHAVLVSFNLMGAFGAGPAPAGLADR